ncbi:MAG: hypothetical protein KGK10_03495 [Rhodospirillales bacterium]|nr:hypothetical protein [Rhodospirillales bacterium]
MWVEGDAGPGLAWWAEVEAREEAEGTIVIERSWGEGETRPERGEETVVPEPDCFTGLIRVLTNQERRIGIPVQVGDRIVVEGLTGWMADFAQLCWIRDEENWPPISDDFAAFSEEQLRRIYRKAGTLTGLYRGLFRPRGWETKRTFHRTFWIIREALQDLPELSGLSLYAAAKQLGVADKDEVWPALVHEVKKLAPDLFTRQVRSTTGKPIRSVMDFYPRLPSSDPIFRAGFIIGGRRLSSASATTPKKDKAKPRVPKR